MEYGRRTTYGYDVFDLVHAARFDWAIVASTKNFIPTFSAFTIQWLMRGELTSLWSLQVYSSAQCSVWHSLLPKTNRSGCKYYRNIYIYKYLVVRCVRFVFVFAIFSLLLFRFCWISESCVLISIILIMRSLTCQHNIHSAASRCAREHEHAVLLSLNSAYTNECLHSQWNFHSNDGFAICAVHANIYGKMLFAPLRAALHNPLASGCNMLCTENDSNDKRERKKCAFLGNDDKSVVDVSNGSQSQSWVVWKKQRGECKTKQKIIIIEELAYQHIHTHTAHFDFSHTASRYIIILPSYRPSPCSHSILPLAHGNVLF